MKHSVSVGLGKPALRQFTDRKTGKLVDAIVYNEYTLASKLNTTQFGVLPGSIWVPEAKSPVSLRAAELGTRGVIKIRWDLDAGDMKRQDGDIIPVTVKFILVPGFLKTKEEVRENITNQANAILQKMSSWVKDPSIPAELLRFPAVEMLRDHWSSIEQDQWEEYLESLDDSEESED